MGKRRFRYETRAHLVDRGERRFGQHDELTRPDHSKRGRSSRFTRPAARVILIESSLRGSPEASVAPAELNSMLVITSAATVRTTLSLSSSRSFKIGKASFAAD